MGKWVVLHVWSAAGPHQISFNSSEPVADENWLRKLFPKVKKIEHHQGSNSWSLIFTPKIWGPDEEDGPFWHLLSAFLQSGWEPLQFDRGEWVWGWILRKYFEDD